MIQVKPYITYYFLLIAFLFGNATNSYAQVTACIQANVTEVCLDAPSFNFTSCSTGATSYCWDFGDNTGTSVQQNPSYNYLVAGAGTYNVVLIACDGPGCTGNCDTDTLTVVVHALPTAAFTASDTVICAPDEVCFYNQSLIGDTAIQSVVWNLGGTISNDPDTACHTFTTLGNFDISLQVVDYHGCANTINLADYLTVNQGPTADFSTSPATGTNPIHVGCYGLDSAVTFTDASTSPNSTIASWSWNFDNGSSGTNTTESVFFTEGTYDVTLTIVDANGCIDSVTKTIQVEDYQAGFTSAGVSGGTVAGCEGLPVVFTDTTATLNNVVSWQWDFDYDGSTFTQDASGSSVNWTYSSTGSFDVALVTMNDYGCFDTVFTSAFVEVYPPPNVGFIADSTINCDYPFTVTFTDTTPGAASWIWDIDNWTTPPLPPDYDWSPDYTDSNFSHTYNDTGCYNVSLIVTDTNGCVDSLVKDDFICIDKPVAEFIADTTMDTSDLQPPFTTKGCVPLKVHFLDLSIYEGTLIPDSIVTWYWDFGDGYTIMGGDSAIPDSTNDCLTYCTYPNPTHIYVDTGSFEVILAVTTSLGCTDTIRMSETIMCLFLGGSCVVEAGMPPHVEFTVNDTVGCHPLSVEFADLSASYANDWSWDFGDGGTETQQNPPYTYQQDVGYFDVSLTAIHNGCESVPFIKDSMIFVAEPRPNFTVHTFKVDEYTDDSHFCFEDSMCTGGWKIEIRDTSKGPDVWVWDLGDTNTTKLIDTLFYNYPETLFVEADTGLHPLDTIFFKAGDTITCDTTFYVIRPADTLTYPDTMIPPNPLVDTLHIMGDLMHWLGMPTTSTILNNDTTAYLYTYYIVPVPDTIIDTLFTIYMSEQYDTTLQDTLNVGCSTQFIEPFNVDTDTAYTVITPYASDTLYYLPHDLVTFDTTISLFYPDTVVVTSQDTIFSSTPDQIIIGDDTVNVTWSYLNVDTFSCTVPADTNFFGIDTVAPDTTNPDTTFLPADTILSGMCDTIFVPADTIVDPPDTVITDTMLKAMYFEHTYRTPGTKTIWLYTWKVCPTCPDSLCIDSTSRDIYISKIDAEFTTNQLFGGDTAGCGPFSAMFMDVTTTEYDSVQRIWDFGDGSSILVSPLFPFLDSPIPPGTHPTPMYPGGSTSGSFKFVQHFYENPGTYNVKMTIIDQYGCEDSVMHQVVVFDNPIPSFIADTTRGCSIDSLKNILEVTFTDTTSNYPSRIVNWIWNYDDGSPTDTTYIPMTNPHQYILCNNRADVTLTVIDENGCQGGPINSADIYTYCPTAAFTPQSQTVCSGTPLKFFSLSNGGSPPGSSAAITALYWDWCDSSQTPLVDTTFSPSATPEHTFIVDTTTVFNVTLTVENEFGCRDYFTLPITVEKAIADFTYQVVDIDTLCPQFFQFTGTCTPPAVSWDWDFGDGNVSVLNPTTNTYVLPGDYDITLIATTALGCIDTILKEDYVTVKGPIIIDTNMIDTSTCAPYAVTFSATAYNTDIFTWYFGDGNDTTFVVGADPANPDTTTITFVYYYNQGGTFQPVLELQDPPDVNGERCPYSYALDPVTVPGPQLGFFTNDTLCGPRAVSFTDTSIGTQDIDIYFWYFGDGNTIQGFGNIPPGTNNDLTTGTFNEPTHYYENPGIYDVTFGAIIQSADSCRYQVLKTEYIVVFDMPLPYYAGCPPLATTFDASSINVDTSNFPFDLDSILWSFGDGATDIGYSVAHTYTSTGDSILITYYDVSAQFGPDCIFTIDSLVAVYPAPIADFYVQPSISGLTISVKLINQTIGGDSIYLWDYDDGSNGVSYPSNPNISHTYEDTGTFNIQLVAYNNFGCSDTVEYPKHIEIKIPNVFNPNSENPQNSVFYIGDFYLDSLTTSVPVGLDIFNRWGQKVFETDHYETCDPFGSPQNCWNGTDMSGKELGTDTYYYVLNLNNQAILSGYVMLLRPKE